MSRFLTVPVVISMVISPPLLTCAVALSTAFTYQGQLLRNSQAVSDTCNFQFILTDIGGTTLATTNPSTLAVPITNGVFSVALDFGAVFSGADRSLRILVSCPGDNGVFTDITQQQRQQLTAAPYALYATSAPPVGAAGGSLSGSYPNPSLQSNSVGSEQIKDGTVASGDVGFNYAGSNSKGGAASDLNCSNCVASSEIGSSQVVKSLNGLTDSVTLQAGSNVTITPAGSSITIAASGGGSAGLSSVAHDSTLTGSGAAATPLGIALPLTLNGNMAVTGNVAIGASTTNSLRRLQIGADDVIGLGVQPGTSPNAAVLRFGDNSGWKLHIGRSREAASITNSPLNTGTTGVLMTVQDNGNVGIGNTGPTGRLQVTSSGGFGNPQLQLDQTTQDDFARIRFNSISQSGCGPNISKAIASNPAWDIAVGGTCGDAEMNFYHAGSNAMTISTSGVTIPSSLSVPAIIGSGSGGVAVQANGHTAYLAGSCCAAYFVGNVHVTGNLSKGSGGFKIDHPLDPDHKFLWHSFVESPDMMNVYNGNVKLDASGTAWVELPDWLEALNRDFRYQLTPIGAFAPIYVAEKIANHRFKIAGGTPDLEVSWQVTGIRQDAFANAHRIPIEEDKSEGERGRYLFPDPYGPSAQSIVP